VSHYALRQLRNAAREPLDRELMKLLQMVWPKVARPTQPDLYHPRLGTDRAPPEAGKTY
jgi:hypothetical protein